MICKFDSSIGLNKHTISSENANEGKINSYVQNYKFSIEYQPTLKVDRIDEVNESYSEPESREKTIEASAIAKYDNNCINLQMDNYRSNAPDRDILNDENMKTQKNSRDLYRMPNSQRRFECNSQLETGENTGALKYRKHCKKLSMDDNIHNPSTTRNISRHRRISVNGRTLIFLNAIENVNNYNPTVVRNMSTPDIIEDYEMTERIPLENMKASSTKNKSERLQKDKAENTKYADKYSLTKN